MNDNSTASCQEFEKGGEEEKEGKRLKDDEEISSSRLWIRIFFSLGKTRHDNVYYRSRKDSCSPRIFFPCSSTQSSKTERTRGLHINSQHLTFAQLFDNPYPVSRLSRWTQSDQLTIEREIPLEFPCWNRGLPGLPFLPCSTFASLLGSISRTRCPARRTATRKSRINIDDLFLFFLKN